MAELILSINKTNRTYRLAVSCLFFLQGLSFASWASRIPSIQQAIGLSDVALGMVLFALPVGSMISVPFSGWLVSKYGSRRVAANALLFYSLFLVFIGLAIQLPYSLAAWFSLVWWAMFQILPSIHKRLLSNPVIKKILWLPCMAYGAWPDL